MEKRNFYHAYNPPPHSPEKNSGELITEQAGYVPANVQIEQMMMAGFRLQQSRGGFEFDDGEAVPDDYNDITRSPNFDMADASALQMAVEAKHRAAIAAQKKADAVVLAAKVAAEAASAEQSEEK